MNARRTWSAALLAVVALGGTAGCATAETDLRQYPQPLSNQSPAVGSPAYPDAAASTVGAEWSSPATLDLAEVPATDAVSAPMGIPGATLPPPFPTIPTPTPLPTGEIRIALLARLGGTANALALDGQYLYVLLGESLVVLDVSDPEAPREVARLEGLGGSQLTAGAGWVHVLQGDRLVAVDVRDPTRPQRTGSLFIGNYAERMGRWAHRIAVAVDRPYPDPNDEVWLVDIVEGGTPRLVGVLQVPKEILDLTVSGPYAYLVDSKSVLRIVDISSPASFVELSVSSPVSATTEAHEGWVAVGGNTAYISYGHGAFRAVSVADPRRPSPIGIKPPYLSSAERLWAADGLLFALYVTEREILDDRSCLETYNAAEPSRNSARQMIAGASRPSDIAASDTHIYIAAGEAGVRIVPRSEGKETVYDPAWSAYDVAVTGRYAYVASGDDGGHGGPGGSVHTIDVGDPAQPRGVGALRVPQDTRKAEADAVAVDGRYVYVGANWWNGRSDTSWAEGPYPLFNSFHVLDAADPANLVEIARLDQTDQHCEGSNACGPLNLRTLVTDGDYVRALYGRSGLRTFDVSDSARPIDLGFAGIQTWHDSAGLDVAGHRAYVTDPEAGLSIVELSGGDAREVGYAWDYHGTGVAAVGRYAYVVGPDMWVVDVSDPAAPKLVSTVEVLGDADGVVRSGALLFVTAADPEAIQAYDISDPAHPRHVGTYEGWTGRAVAHGDLLFLANGTGGLTILEVVR